MTSFFCVRALARCRAQARPWSSRDVPRARLGTAAGPVSAPAGPCAEHAWDPWLESRIRR